MRKNTRICTFCHKEIDILSTDEKFFFFNKSDSIVCSHDECYIQYQTSKRRKPMTLEECQNFIKENKENPPQKKKSIRTELYDFIFDMYDITYLPRQFYLKLDLIFKGTYQKIKRKVPPEDLLDMWKQKKNYLLKQAEYNRKKGNEIEGVGQVYYDLAVLLSKYDGYLKWKEQQKLAQTEQKKQKAAGIEYCAYQNVSQIKPKEKENNVIDISSMLDEI